MKIWQSNCNIIIKLFGTFVVLINKMKKLSIIIIIASIFFSCAKEGPTGPTGATGAIGPSGPAYTGVINGHVSLYDQYGSKIISGLKGVTLLFNKNLFLNPDSTGYYIDSNVITGDYNISASITGFASTYINNFQFLKDTLNRDIKLSIIPSFNPISGGISAIKTALNDSVIINFSADTRARNCILFVSNSNSVSNNVSQYLLVYTKTITANSTKTIINIPAQDLFNVGFTSGSLVYLAAYGYVNTDYSLYEDFTTGKNVYNAVSANPVIDSAIVP